MGVTVLQTSIGDKEPEEIYILYKKRWNIETFYNYFKNKAGYISLHEEDHYKTQRLAFIMLINSLIYYEIAEAVKAVGGKSIETCLLEAWMVKAHKRHGQCTICNCLKKQVALFRALNTGMQFQL